MVISTRPPAENDNFKDRLIELLDHATLGTVGLGPKAEVPPGNTVQEILDDLNLAIEGLHEIGEELTTEILGLQQDLARSVIQISQLMSVVDKLTVVSYDEALDHAATDLIDAICGTVSESDITSNGDLSFDGHVTITKADLKPALREAIRRWVDLRIR